MRVFRERVFRVEHPDGGAFFLLPAKGDEMKELDELVSVEYVVHDGELVFNAKTGMPVARSRQNIEAVIQRAIRKVKAIEGIEVVDPCPVCNGSGRVDESPCAPCDGSGNGEKRILESTAANIEFLVRTYIGTRSIDVEIPAFPPNEQANGKPFPTTDPPKKMTEKRDVPEPLYLWVAENVKTVTEQLREEQRKNS